MKSLIGDEPSKKKKETDGGCANGLQTGVAQSLFVRRSTTEGKKAGVHLFLANMGFERVGGGPLVVVASAKDECEHSEPPMAAGKNVAGRVNLAVETVLERASDKKKLPSVQHFFRYTGAEDAGGSISYSHFQNFMLLPLEPLEDDPWNIWFEAATVVSDSRPVEIAAGDVLTSALAGGLACAFSTSVMHPPDTMKDLPESQRADAVSSMVYEANARIRDPVYGCAGAICQLQKQVSELQAQLARAQAELVNMQAQQANVIALVCMEMAQSQQPSTESLVTGPYLSQSDAFLLDDNSHGSLWEDPLWT
ncbi:hypothetical protein COCNU_04G014430 [Cocos nucifera]|uniref:LOB domain-containing protein n=1 Tax=Cocos nucifera TaxID=13894 RepID=A0A8K0I7V1_COCNU|nr:hypothetical protein COCNU_04G014430 [Cocos nucifera]